MPTVALMGMVNAYDPNLATSEMKDLGQSIQDNIQTANQLGFRGSQTERDQASRHLDMALDDTDKLIVGYAG